MNKKLLKVITPVALMAVVGTGFSAWVFNKTATNSTSDLTISIDTATEGGAIAIANATSSKFSIKQGTSIAKNSNSNDLQGNVSYDDGLTFTWGSLSANYYNDKGTGRVDEETDKQTIVRTYTVTLSSTMSQYFKIVKGASGNWEDNEILGSGTGASSDSKGTELVIDWVSDSAKPKNMTEYQAMCTTLTGNASGTTVASGITVTFTATVSDKA